MMDWELVSDITTKIMALWGMVLSTILGIREISREKKKLTIILEHVAWYEQLQMVLVNPGNHPITISNIAMETIVPDQDKGHWEPVPQMALLGDLEEAASFPIVIKERESITLPFSQVLTGYLLENGMQAKITVYDVEGDQYTKFKARVYDAKWGHYSEI